MDFNTNLPSTPLGQLVESFNPLWWNYVLGLFALIGLAFFLIVLYHWIRYEVDTKLSLVVVIINAVVIISLLGGAWINLGSYLLIA